MAPAVFDRVTRRFGDVEAVADLNLEVEESDFLVLLGPSGCGKSTLLRMLAGLEEATQGGISVKGPPGNGGGPRVATRAAPELGLVRLMARKPGQLSGGQRQRVALARAIVRRPEAFL